MNRNMYNTRNVVAATAAVFLVLAGSGMTKGDTTDQPTISLAPQQLNVLPGDTVQVDAFITNVQDIGTYQLCLIGKASDGQVLTLSTMAINKTHKTFLFGSEQVVEAIDQKGKRLAVITFGQGVDVAADEQRYLATFTFEVPKDAKGSLQFVVDQGQETMLLHGSGEKMTYGVGAAVSIQVVGDTKIRAIKRDRSTR